jgi:DNA-directed RNA polymerase
LLEAYYQALENITPTMHLLKHTISSIWDSTKTRYQWTLPNGNVTDYNTIETGRITVNPYGMMNIDMLASAIMPSSRSTGLLVNIIHSIDAYVASEMVVRCSKAGVDMTGFDIVTIHDAFRCHPNHAVAMRDIYVALMAEITDGRILEDIIQEISGKEVKSFAKLFKGADVLRSRYAIC